MSVLKKNDGYTGNPLRNLKVVIIGIRIKSSPASPYIVWGRHALPLINNDVVRQQGNVRCVCKKDHVD